MSSARRRWVPQRRGRQEDGFAVAELALGLAVVVLPLALVMMSLPSWFERASLADMAAATAAREVVLADTWPQGLQRGTAEAQQLAANHQLPAGDLAVSFRGRLARGATVTAQATVRMPGFSVPFVGSFGSWSLTRSHTEAVDLYRSF
jgi:hypothetical protein